MKEYTIKEVFEFEEGTEFETIDSKSKVRVNKESLEVELNNTFWAECNLSKGWLETKFTLVKKDKEVSFMDAMKAYGKIVYCTYNDKNNNKITKEFLINSNIPMMIYIDEILNAKWFIKAD